MWSLQLQLQLQFLGRGCRSWSGLVPSSPSCAHSHSHSGGADWGTSRVLVIMILIRAQLNTHFPTPFKLQPLHPSLARRYLTPRQQKGTFQASGSPLVHVIFLALEGDHGGGAQGTEAKVPVVVTLKLFFFFQVRSRIACQSMDVNPSCT